MSLESIQSLLRVNGWDVNQMIFAAYAQALPRKVVKRPILLTAYDIFKGKR